jgi:hypothetical protein
MRGVLPYLDPDPGRTSRPSNYELELGVRSKGAQKPATAGSSWKFAAPRTPNVLSAMVMAALLARTVRSLEGRG